MSLKKYNILSNQNCTVIDSVEIVHPQKFLIDISFFLSFVFVCKFPITSKFYVAVLAVIGSLLLESRTEIVLLDKLKLF